MAFPWLAVLYGTLLIHTAVEAPFFTPLITTKSRLLRCVILALAVVYILLAWSLHSTKQFFALTALVFALAAIGYSMLFRITHSKKFQQKIFIDGAGALSALGTLLGITTGYGTQLIPVVTVLYMIVTVWMLWMRPYYRE